MSLLSRQDEELLQNVARRRSCEVCGGVEDLEDQIARLNGLKVAQVPDSEASRLFQAEIDELTRLWHEVKAAAPRLARLDAAIEEADEELRAANAERSEAAVAAQTATGRLLRPAAWAGVLGVLLLLVGLTFSLPPLLWVVCVALVLGSIGLVLFGVRDRRNVQDWAAELAHEVMVAQGKKSELEEQRRVLAASVGRSREEPARVRPVSLARREDQSRVEEAAAAATVEAVESLR